MKILVACEESQIVTTEFRKRKHMAFSCDIIQTSGNYPEYHIQCDVREIINDDWDMVLAFPPCSHLACSGARYFEQKRKDGRQQAAIDFFMLFTKISCEKVAIENSIGIMSTLYRKPDQIIQPYMFGHERIKSTCLWLKNLPKLQPTKIMEKRESNILKFPPSKDRIKLRSKTYEGIAAAMAEQWG